MSEILRVNCIKVSLIGLLLLFFQSTKGQQFADAVLQFERSGKELGSQAVLAIVQPGKPVFVKLIGEMTPKDQAPLGSISQ